MDQDVAFEHWSPNFVETVACAMSENVYSAAIAWLLSTADLPEEARRAILLALVPSLPDTIHITRAEREWRDIDVLVHMQVAGVSGVIAIENKIKALEHSQQLAKYDRALADANHHAHAKVFLTLLGSAPGSGVGWIRAPYASLLTGLRRARELAPQHPYLADFMSAVGRLVTAIDLVMTVPEYARIAFGADSPSVAPGFADYVLRAGLGNTLGQAWLTALGRRVIGQDESPWSIKAEETHGEPLVNIARVVRLQGVDVNMGLQLQRWRLQAFVEPYPYKMIRSASTEQRAAVDACIEQAREALSLSPLQRAGSPGAKHHRGLRLPASAESFDAAQWAAEIRRFLRLLERIPC